MSPPSSAPSSPITGRPSRRRKGHTSTGGLDRGDKSGTQSRPPWNVHTPQHAYIKNTDRDPNMHTRKKLQVQFLIKFLLILPNYPTVYAHSLRGKQLHIN